MWKRAFDGDGSDYEERALCWDDAGDRETPRENHVEAAQRQDSV